MGSQPTMLIYGAGNIGRGFLADLGHQSGYECVFIDIRNDIIDTLNHQMRYKHITVGEKGIVEKEITQVQGILGSNQKEVITAITKADLITTAVGKDALPYIIPTLQKGILARISKGKKEPLALTAIAFENIHGNTEHLKSLILQGLSPTDQKNIQDLVQFPNSLVDRIVPNYYGDNILDVCVEEYYQIAIDGNAIDEFPGLQGVEISKDLDALADQKLFTLNMGHALTAYLGHLAGKKYIHEAIHNKNIYEIVHSTMTEVGNVLHAQYPDTITLNSHKIYAEKTISRFMNHYLNDEISRVARDPIRKLGPQDRLIYPFLTLHTYGLPAYYLGSGIASALHYVHEQDIQSIQLQKELYDAGVQHVIQNRLGINNPEQISLIQSNYLLRSL